MPRVVHVELSADDPERAVRFYRDVFGWKIQKWDGPEDYWLVMTGEPGGPGIDGGIMRRSEFNDDAPVIVLITGALVDDGVARIEQNRGTVVAPRMPAPGVGYVAYCKDSAGNMFGVMQSDPSAQ